MSLGENQEKIGRKEIKKSEERNKKLGKDVKKKVNKE